jgi:hypothetical protein
VAIALHTGMDHRERESAETREQVPCGTRDAKDGGVKSGRRDAGAKPGRDKNPHAAALGRLGGRKGGRARAAALTADERRRSARKAALARWGRKKKR